MRYGKIFVTLLIGIGVLLVGCNRESAEKKLEKLLESNGFYQGIGTIKSGGKTHQGKSADTLWTCDFYDEVSNPAIDYIISIDGITGSIDLDIDWDVTFYTIYYKDTTGTSRDTIVKPAPQYHGVMKFYYEKGNKWELKGITPCNLYSDSAGDYIKIDSIRVSHNGTYLATLTDPSVRFDADDWPFTSFSVGDSVTLELWHSGNAEIPCAFAPDITGLSHWEYNSADKYAKGTWEIKNAGDHWAWIGMIDLLVARRDHKAISVRAWGMPYRVE